MKKETYGYMYLEDTVNITDPCYGANVWCRINNFPVSEGVYECYTVAASDYETHGWGERIAKCGIRKEGSNPTQYEQKGSIGVDAGMAGFFTCDNEAVFENEILKNSCKDVYYGENYFCTSSGYGDGAYPVYAGYEDGKIVEVYIEFI